MNPVEYVLHVLDFTIFILCKETTISRIRPLFIQFSNALTAQKKKVLNSRITSNGLISTMTYLPQSDVELITLACWASNAVGHQSLPCLIHILPASK